MHSCFSPQFDLFLPFHPSRVSFGGRGICQAGIEITNVNIEQIISLNFTCFSLSQINRLRPEQLANSILPFRHPKLPLRRRRRPYSTVVSSSSSPSSFRLQPPVKSHFTDDHLGVDFCAIHHRLHLRLRRRCDGVGPDSGELTQVHFFST